MPSVSETIVREYFEIHEFLVRQQRKYVSPTSRAGEDDDIDFFVLNPHPLVTAEPRPFVLGSPDLPFIDRAIVVVKGWHTETFSSARLESRPDLFRFVEPRVFQAAARSFGTAGTPLKLLVVPALPQKTQAREESVNLLRAKGIDGVILFRTMLLELVAKVEVNRNYEKSDLLQVLRILKTHDLIREPQLELFKAKRGKPTKRT